MHIYLCTPGVYVSTYAEFMVMSTLKLLYELEFCHLRQLSQQSVLVAAHGREQSSPLCEAPVLRLCALPPCSEIITLRNTIHVASIHCLSTYP